jgi:hypothetical protein
MGPDKSDARFDARANLKAQVGITKDFRVEIKVQIVCHISLIDM